MVDHIVEMSNQYTIEKSVVGWIPLSKGEFCCFLGIVMLSDYVELSSYKMYWEEVPDVQNYLVKNTMQRNKFQLILKNLHFYENSY